MDLKRHTNALVCGGDETTRISLCNHAFPLKSIAEISHPTARVSTLLTVTPTELGDKRSNVLEAAD